MLLFPDCISACHPIRGSKQLLCLELERPSKHHGWYFWSVPPSSGGTAHGSPVGLKQEDLVDIDADCLEAVHLESQEKENHW